MAIQEYAHSDLAGVVDDLVHNLKRTESRKIRISVEVDAAGDAAWIKRLSAVRKAKRVVSEALHLVEHVHPVSSPETVRTEGIGFHPKPVDSGHPHRLSVGINNLSSVCVPEASAA